MHRGAHPLGRGRTRGPLCGRLQQDFRAAFSGRSGSKKGRQELRVSIPFTIGTSALPEVPSMRRLFTCATLLLIILAQSLPSTGQTPIPNTGLPQPRLLIVMPTGARAGGTTELTVTGQDLDDAQG